MLVNLQVAESQLSQLLVAAENGEDVIIARDGHPAVRLVPITGSGFQFNALRDQVTKVPDFDEPMDEAELALWEGGHCRDGYGVGMSVGVEGQRIRGP